MHAGLEVLRSLAGNLCSPVQLPEKRASHRDTVNLGRVEGPRASGGIAGGRPEPPRLDLPRHESGCFIPLLIPIDAL